MPRIEITNEMRNSQEIIKRFQKEMFSGRIQCYNECYDMIQLDYADEDELYLQHSRKFSRPEFQRVKRYQIECKKCKTKLWAQVKSTFAVKRHMEMCKKKSSIKNEQKSNNELYFQPNPNCNLRIPVTSEKEVYELALRLGNDENFQHKLGMEVISQRQFADSKETGVRSVIRRMMKEIICEDMCNRMNTTGRSSKLSATCDGSSVKAIKTPDTIMRFLAKYSAILTNTNEEDTYCEVKKVITRWISDERNNKFLRKNRRLKQRIERQMLTMVGNQASIDPMLCIPPSASHHLMNTVMLNANDARLPKKKEQQQRDPLIQHIEHL